jgi:hypothetical protein
MAKSISRRARRTLRSLNDGAADIQGMIEQNPVTAAVTALAAGVIATSIYKMTVGKPAAPAAKSAKRKSRTNRA